MGDSQCTMGGHQLCLVICILAVVIPHTHAAAAGATLSVDGIADMRKTVEDLRAFTSAQRTTNDGVQGIIADLHHALQLLKDKVTQLEQKQNTTESRIPLKAENVHFEATFNETQVNPGPIKYIQSFVTLSRASSEDEEERELSLNCGTSDWMEDANTGRCYMTVSEPLSWSNANKRCQMEGGQLLSIGSPEEQNFIKGLARNMEYYSAWLGGRRIQGQLPNSTDGTGWEWFDGTPFKFMNWLPNEPNNHGGYEECLGIKICGRWRDMSCELKLKSICERPGIIAEGVFTAPISGVYQLSFTAWTPATQNRSIVADIRNNNWIIARTSSNSVGMFGTSVEEELKAGDKVAVFLSQGAIGGQSERSAKFFGKLVQQAQFAVTKARNHPEEHLTSKNNNLIDLGDRQVLMQLLERVDKVDTALQLMTLEKAQLENKVGLLVSDKAMVDKRVKYLEAITMRNVPRTCNELKAQGVVESGEYLIDPDGVGIGEAPITVFCDMATGATVINHNIEGPVSVDHCSDPGCHVTQATYSAPAKQIAALVGLSVGCSQAISYNCYVAPLIKADTNFAWWVGTDGEPTYYWHGNVTSDTHACACADSETCINPIFTCNCDSSAPEWFSDEGILTNKEILPVQELRFGGLVFDPQEATFELGPFQCSGREPLQSIDSCETLKMAGVTTTGYYLVHGAGSSGDGLHYNVVLCNMDLDSANDDFQVETTLKFPEFPVAFDFRRTHPYTTARTVVPYEQAVVNIGEAMTLDGNFTAPFDGVYAFTFSFIEGNIHETLVFIRLNGWNNVARILSKELARTGVQYDSASQTIVLSLIKGDTVNVFLEHGEIIDGVADWAADAHFTGYLLYPL